MKKNFFFIASFIVSFANVQAADLLLGTSPKNDLILRSNSCEQLIEQHNKICLWKKSLSPQFKIPQIDKKLCIPSKTKLLSMTVSTCLPDFVKQNQSKKQVSSGANCWGTAMNFKGISQTPRYIWTDEMIYWMNSPICRKLAPGEEKLPGDIINVYGPEYIFPERDEKDKGHIFLQSLAPKSYTASPVMSGYSGYHHFLHSETYVSDELTFGKESPSLQDKFKFSLIKSVYGRSRDNECQENQSFEPHFREKQNAPREIKYSRCDYFTNVYRCEDFNQYLDQQLLSNGELVILDEINSLKKIQNRLFPMLSSKLATISVQEQNVILKSADKSAGIALLRLSERDLNKNTEMLLTLQYFSAQGIRKSLELAELIPATEPL